MGSFRRRRPRATRRGKGWCGCGRDAGVDRPVVTRRRDRVDDVTCARGDVRFPSVGGRAGGRASAGAARGRAGVRDGRGRNRSYRIVRSIARSSRVRRESRPEPGSGDFEDFIHCAGFFREKPEARESSWISPSTARVERRASTQARVHAREYTRHRFARRARRARRRGRRRAGEPSTRGGEPTSRPGSRAISRSRQKVHFSGRFLIFCGRVARRAPRGSGEGARARRRLGR